MASAIDPETGEITMEQYYANIPFMRTPFNYNRDADARETSLICPEPTKAQQQFAEDSDINVLAERYNLTGEIPQNVRVPLPDEFIETVDYQQAQNVLVEADRAFMQMPANVRKEFDNDPGKFLAFVHDDNNRKRAEELGIVNLPPAPPAPAPAPADPPKPA